MNPDQQMEFADYSYLPPEAGEGAVVVAPAATMAEPTPMWAWPALRMMAETSAKSRLMMTFSL